MIEKTLLISNELDKSFEMVKASLLNMSNYESIVFFSIILIFSMLLSTAAYILTKRNYLRKNLKEKIKELEKLYEEKGYNYKIFSKTKDVEDFKVSQAKIVIRQEVLREEIKKLVEENKFLEKMQKKEAEKTGEKIIKKRTTEKKTTARGIWLLGLSRKESEEIYERVRERIKEKIINKMDEKNEEELKEELIEEEGFKPRNAEKIIEYCKKEMD